MPTFYLDTSALTKRYRDEDGSNAVARLFELLERPENKAATSFFTYAELLAVATRLLKGKRITQDAYDDLMVRLLRDLNTYFSINALNFGILARTAYIIKRHALKAPDAQQLATALELRAILNQLDEGLVFVADDEELLEAAKREGLEVINPREKDALKKLNRLAKGR